MDAVAACPAVRCSSFARRSRGFCAGLCPFARISSASPARTGPRSRGTGSGYSRSSQRLDIRVPRLHRRPVPRRRARTRSGLRSPSLRGTTQRRTSASLSGSPASAAHRELNELAGRRGREPIESGRTSRVAKPGGWAWWMSHAASAGRRSSSARYWIDFRSTPGQASPPSCYRGLAMERRVFSAAPMPSVNQRPTETASSAPAFPPTIGLLGNNAQAEQFIAAAALLGRSAVVCGDRSGIFALVAESESRGFITPLEAEQVRIRVRASDNLDGFENAGLVFVADGHNPFRLAAVVRPRTVVCVVCPTGRDLTSSSRGWRCPSPFRVVSSGSAFAKRIASRSSPIRRLIPRPYPHSRWLRHLGYTSLVFPVAARLLPRAA